uniref:Uncharacterized protein n=1 Tax=Amphimedon queenslandica TaxID=400682 RepID=A0A1X7TRK8_AMPQE
MRPAITTSTTSSWRPVNTTSAWKPATSSTMSSTTTSSLKPCHMQHYYQQLEAHHCHL